MKKPAIIAIDQGTHATRAMLFDQTGFVLYETQVEISLKRINEFRVEQDAGEILQSVFTVLNDVINHISMDFYPASIGLATQRSSILAIRKNGEAITPVISWQDTRTVPMLFQYRSYEPLIKQITGLPLSAHYGATKIRWLLQNNKDVQQAREVNDLQFAPLAAYLLRNLLDEGYFLIDHANAARTLLLNLESARWDEELLRIFEIDQTWLPVCVPVSYDFGHIKGIPVKTVTGDQNAAVFSQGLMPPDSALVNIGTGAFILKPTGSVYVTHENLLSGLIFSDDGPQGQQRQYTLEGTVNGAASAWNWARQKLTGGEKFTIEEILAYRRQPVNIPLFLNTVGGLGSPFWRQGNSPQWLPQMMENMGDIKASLAAVLESILFLIMINIKEIEAKNFRTKSLIVTGGLAASDLMCNLLAEIAHVPVKRPAVPEATARGTAFLAAGRPEGWIKNPETEFFPPDFRNEALIARFEKFRRTI